MRKFVCLVVALLMGLSSVALAASPSRTVSDMTQFEVSAENVPADSGFFLQPVSEAALGESVSNYQERIDVAQVEVAKLNAVARVQEYFGDVVDSDGNSVDLQAFLGEGQLVVHELMPIIAGEYEESYGTVTMQMLFATPYAIDEKVAVMVGIVTTLDDGTQQVNWTIFEGVGVAAQGGETETMGCIRTNFDAETVRAIQDGIAILAIVSQE